MDTTGYQVSDLEDFDFNWKDPHLNTDAVSQPGIDTSFFPSTSNNFELGSLAENPRMTDIRPLLETPVRERPTRPTVLMRSCPFAMFPTMFPEICLKEFF